MVLATNMSPNQREEEKRNQRISPNFISQTFREPISNGIHNGTAQHNIVWKTDMAHDKSKTQKANGRKGFFSKEKGSLVTPKGIKPQHHVKVIPCCGKYNRWHRWHRWIDGSFKTYWLPSLPPQTSIKSLPVLEIVVNSHCENAVEEKTY